MENKVNLEFNGKQYEVNTYIPVVKQHEIAYSIFKRIALKDEKLGLLLKSPSEGIISDTLIICAFLGINIPEEADNSEIFSKYDEFVTSGIIRVFMDSKEDLFFDVILSIEKITKKLFESSAIRYAKEMELKASDEKYKNSLEYRVLTLLNGVIGDDESIESIATDLSGLKELFIGLMDKRNIARTQGIQSFGKKNKR